MRIHTLNFGDLDIVPDAIIIFDDGLPGFPQLRRFVILERDENTILIHFTGEPYYLMWRKEHLGEDYSDRFISSVTVTTVNTITLARREVTLFPDENGNIPLYTNSLLLYNDAMRIRGQRNQLDIRLAE